MMDETRWGVVYIASGLPEANIIVGRLEVEGIAARLKYEAVGPIYAITVDGLGEVRVLVPAEDLERARAVLAQVYDEKDLNWESG
jgi:hypothetical protein